MLSEYSLKNTAATKLLIQMRLQLEKAAIILTIALILLCLASGNVNIAFSSSTGGKLDLFTQKDPYSGTGPDMSSDAFGPGESAIIYALITYNNYPVPNIPVAFEIRGPPNTIENITVYRTIFTNSIGIATTSFTIPHEEETAFGIWTVISNANMGGTIIQDTLTFKVGWIVEVVTIKTLSENKIEQEKFALTQQVIIELALKNIALTEKTATLTVTTYDSLNRSLYATQQDNVAIPPNETVTYAYFHFYIPKNTSLALATVYANAYTAPISQGGTPYCPEVSKKFLIVKNDVAIANVEAFPKIVYKGDIIHIDVTVMNKGSEYESFTITVYGNETYITQATIIDLQPFSQRTLKLTWNTSDASEGIYQISAYAIPVPNEIDVSDNDFIGDYVKIELELQRFHDIAILNVIPVYTSVHIGDILSVTVVVKNLGNYTENFNVTLYQDSNIIGILIVKNLESETERVLVFQWNTANMPEGNYLLKALASSVPGEINLENNSFVDGTVELVKAPARWFVPDWFYWLWILLPMLALLLLLILIYRRRKKKDENSFNSGWTAWYYCHNLRNKQR
ncbi:hypothetical protein HXY32_00260 [Candidatus Bathyarchaeota archaeon]|nr:hypothetical protein [Candidatus Bathyarchaeota archaeon]